MWSARVFGAARPVSVAAILGWGATTVKDETPAKEPMVRIERPTEKVDGNLLSRQIVNAQDQTGLKLKLFQYETCPFCCKVRAFLDYHGFSYDVIEVNPVTRSQIKFANNYKKVPILRVCDQHSLTESSLIVSQLMTFLVRNDRSLEDIIAMYPPVESTDEKGKTVKNYPSKYFIMKEKVDSTGEMANQKEEREWREWVDNHFIHLISPNVYRTWNESLETFKWFEKVGDWHRTFPNWERCLAVYVGAAAMFALSKRLKKRHNIDDERKALEDACTAWMNAIGPNRLFLGGDKPNLADLSLYGAMNSFYGCRAFKEVVEQGPISEWFIRMKKQVEERAGRHLVAQKRITL